MIFKEQSFYDKKTNKEIFYVAANTPITIADLENGNFDIPDNNNKKSNKSSMPNDMADSYIDDKDIPF